ncbi:hypothetical protein ACT3CE_09945 [Marinifilum sp. RC60d5]|uniref:hypothetical protein n=1 Tax=Marinifilum sp. RC60d5 TaxID=3458414 RepID=UPI00403605BC
MSKQLQLKKELYKLALENLQSTIDENKKALVDLKESVGSESKSTAGDKHETGRAMIHLEQEKANKQMQNSLELKKVLDQVNLDKMYEEVSFGSLVITNKICFYLLAALGQYSIGENQYYFVSLHSEIAKAFMGKKAGEVVVFKNQSFTINEIV